MSNSSRDPRRIVLIPIADIRRERQPWHVRVVVTEAEIAKLADLIRMTGAIDPITVVLSTDGYLLALGLLRLLAAERLGHEVIPAYVEKQPDPLNLLQRQLADDEAGARYRTLEKSWALVKVDDLLKELGVQARQKTICGLRKLDKGTVSSGLKAGRAIPEERLRRIASAHDLDWESVTALPREAVRRIASAPDDVRDELLHAACGALGEGENPRRAVDALISQFGSTANPAGKRRPRFLLLLRAILAWFATTTARALQAVGDWVRTPARAARRTARHSGGPATGSASANEAPATRVHG